MGVPRIYLFTLALITITHTVKALDNQYTVTPVVFNDFSEDSLLIQELARPIRRFSQSTIRCFLKHSFSRAEYTEQLLPHTFAHLLEFLEYGTDTGKNVSYALSTIRLFSNRVKSCTYVSPDAIEVLLDRIPELLERYFVRTPTSLFTEAKNSIKRILYTTFLTKFNFFKSDPDGFFDDLSNEIMQGINNTHLMQNSIDNEQLRQSLIRFLEIVLDKVIWTPFDQDEVWISVKTTSAKLQELTEINIITMDELDDLYQSLLARFIHFLNVAGADLPISTIDAIKSDIQAQNLLLLTLEEQEEFIIPKVERLKQALERVEMKIIAKAQGIIA